MRSRVKGSRARAPGGHKHCPAYRDSVETVTRRRHGSETAPCISHWVEFFVGAERAFGRPAVSFPSEHLHPAIYGCAPRPPRAVGIGARERHAIVPGSYSSFVLRSLSERPAIA